MPTDRARETGDRAADDWERIDTEHATRDEAQRRYDEAHDPGEVWEKSARPLPEGYGKDRPASRTVQADQAAEMVDLWGQEQFEKLVASGRIVIEGSDGSDRDTGPDDPHESAEEPERGESEEGLRTPAEYRPELADRLPEWTRGAKTEGLLVRADNGESLWGDRIVESGYEGPAKLYHPRELGLRHGWWNLSHVETHAAATLRSHENETTDVALYINKEPCKGSKGCDANLEAMLPEGGKLTVFWPGGSRVYIGKPDEHQAD